MNADRPSAVDVKRMFGDIEDHKVVAILGTGASMEELEEALAYLAGESDVMGKARHPLSGRVAMVYEIIARDEPSREEEAGG